MHTDVPPWLESSRNPAPPPGRRGGGWAWALLAVVVLILAAGAGLATHRLHSTRLSHLVRRLHLLGPAATTAPAAPHSTPPPATLASLPAPGFGPQKLPPAWPGPLPYPLLITDAGSAKVLEVTPAGKVVWQYPEAGAAPVGGTLPAPTDAAFAPDGASVVAASERQDVVSRVDFYAKRALWQFGVAGQPGEDATHLDYPDDPHVLANGDTVVADIRNCRVVTLGPDGKPVTTWGKPQSGYCQTDLAHGLFGYPNGADPQADGSVLLSFSSGDHVALLGPDGTVRWDVTAPNLYGGFVSDAHLLPGGDVLVCGYAAPGSVVRFAPQHGGVNWHYFVASGPGALSHPTDAVPLPNGDIAVADGGNHRVVVIDPGTDQIVWQYATGLTDPEGLDLDVYRDWQGWLASTGGASGTGH